MSDVLLLNAVSRSYAQGEGVLSVLSQVNLRVQAGEFVALTGPSGCGKSTLLHIAGLLDVPDAGEVIIAGQPMHNAKDSARTLARLTHIGFVYQFHHLLPEFSALENVMMPLLIAGVAEQEAQPRAQALLQELGLAARLRHRPAKLSGGEQQRVAIARALVSQPKLLLADEPTGNLDSSNAEQVFSLLLSLARQRKLAIVMATHNPELAARMDRVFALSQRAA